MRPSEPVSRTVAAGVRAAEQAVARMTRLRAGDLSDLARVLGRHSETGLDIGTAQPAGHRGKGRRNR